ncbi:hypothetical protein PUMCH_005194 [Australozyma saopauloensis]|uniref:JmjC domain-containing protein n=1 Tax=Australozyma saopauloensis TaxID=291208 RepID=A0AAX4HH57_9ASCO|nr:hypothetical protein PUMCH_005194 [[Candida] saopauloensis]
MSSSAPQRKKKVLVNGYSGFRIPQEATVAASADPKTFYTEFIESRTPAVVKHEVPIAIADFKLLQIEKRLQYDELLQVERKVAFGFGLGTQRELKTLSQIVDKLKLGDDTYYLTTQYEAEASDEEIDESDDESEADSALGGLLPAANGGEDSSEESDFPEDLDGVDDFDEMNDSGNDVSGDSDSEEIDTFTSENYVVPEFELTEEAALSRVKTLLQPPLTNVVHHGAFPIVPKQFEPLVTQQINLWMGCASKSSSPDLKNPTVASLGKYVPKGNSSGLHHDHADNLYLLVEGAKRFTLYLPGDAEKIFTVGNIRKVYANGLIDYCADEKAPFWRPLRADGAMILDWAAWKLEQDGISEKERKYLEDALKMDCYASTEDGSSKKSKDEPEVKMDPPSFLTVPPILAHLDEVDDPEAREALKAFAEEHFPGFLSLKKMEVWLKPGDMLYLPAGWFHEVTSFGDDENAQHVALNWWFVPPVNKGALPYEDEYWAGDFKATLAALEWAKEKQNNDL